MFRKHKKAKYCHCENKSTKLYVTIKCMIFVKFISLEKLAAQKVLHTLPDPTAPTTAINSPLINIEILI